MWYSWIRHRASVAAVILIGLAALGVAKGQEARAEHWFLLPLPASGVGLNVWQGGAISELAVAAPHAASFWVTVDGQMVGYVAGAPPFVNASFSQRYSAGVPPQTPMLIVVREGATYVPPPAHATPPASATPARPSEPPVYGPVPSTLNPLYPQPGAPDPEFFLVLTDTLTANLFIAGIAFEDDSITAVRVCEGTRRSEGSCAMWPLQYLDGPDGLGTVLFLAVPEVGAERYVWAQACNSEGCGDHRLIAVAARHESEESSFYAVVTAFDDYVSVTAYNMRPGTAHLTVTFEDGTTGTKPCQGIGDCLGDIDFEPASGERVTIVHSAGGARTVRYTP